ncbi:MAG: integrase [Candidatus Daviesbacteria bacterium]|nr:integrase [Candidatus Daviesbacteria bacterium]
MKVTMDDSRLTNIIQLKEFLKGSLKMVLSLEDSPLEDKYAFITKTIRRFYYQKLPKKDKHIVIKYLHKVTGYKNNRLYQFVKRAEIGTLKKVNYVRLHPVKIYVTKDIKLLEKTDEVHLRLSEDATREILRREYEIFGNKDYQTIAGVSHSHITNLRHSPVYKSSWINHTKARQIPIGITQKPLNYGKPGSIRVDSVSQKDVYHINAVDEINQWEIVFCVPQLSELYMLPALEFILDQYPFVIFNFHSDRGKETINYLVADLLQRLVIKQTKSRSYHSGDNALVETKNGSVIRKNMGWEHINQSMCDDINDYYKNFFNPYLNFHRPCAYPTVIEEKSGKKKKVYDKYQVPYEFLKDLPNTESYLKPGVTFENLDKIAYSHSDNAFATIMREEERKLFQKIREQDKKSGSQRKT